MDQYHSNLFIIQLVGYSTSVWKWIQLFSVLLTTTFRLLIIVRLLLISHLSASSSCDSPFWCFLFLSVIFLPQHSPFHHPSDISTSSHFPPFPLLPLCHFEASPLFYRPFCFISHFHLSDVLFRSPCRACLNTEYTNIRSCLKRDSNPQAPIWRS